MLRGTVLAFLALAAIVAPSFVLAQDSFSAPPGWKSETRAGGATVFTPPNLQPGEVYKIAVYDSAPLDGKPLEEWLRAFAGPTGKGPGKLSAPLKVTVTENRVVSGTGVYAGPNGTTLGAVFMGVSLDNENIHVLRLLSSGQQGLMERYRSALTTLTGAMTARAKREAGDNIVRVPASVAKIMKPGGAIVPGVYVGNQYSGGELRYRFRVYLYASGEYRICDHKDEDFRYNTGTVSYNVNSGKLSINSQFDLTNSRVYADDEFCFFGRDAQNKPLIYAEENVFSRRTTLRYEGPPTKRAAPGAEKAAIAAAEAEKKRYKHVLAPGKGVKAEQIAAVVHHYDVQVYSAGVSGMGTNVKDEAYLLLKDGTIHAGLEVPPDQLDVTRSRQKEPNTWGRWRLKNGKYQVSWDGGPYQPLPGYKVLPGQPGQRLQGRWGTGSSSASLAGSSYRLWGVTFTPNGRFKKDGRGGSGNSTFMQSGGQPAINSTYDDKGSVTSATGADFAVVASRKNNPNGDREGTYTIDGNGYAMTLRYDNGAIARIPFFFGNKSRSTLWFEGDQLALDDGKK